MILIINTADQKEVFIGLADKGELAVQKKFQAQYRQAEKLLLEVDKLIQKQGIKLEKLKSIVVVSGPGPFTALRIGVVTANTLAWALKIPVAGVKLAEFDNIGELIKISEKKIKQAKVGAIVEPAYGKEPNIGIGK